MRLQVELHGDLKKYSKGSNGKFDLELPEKATVADLVKHLGVDKDEEWSAAINGQLAYPEDSLKEGAEVLLFPPIAGG